MHAHIQGMFDYEMMHHTACYHAIFTYAPEPIYPVLRLLIRSRRNLAKDKAEVMRSHGDVQLSEAQHHTENATSTGAPAVNDVD